MDYPCLDLCFASLKTDEPKRPRAGASARSASGSEFGRERRRQERALPAGRDLQRDWAASSAADEHYEALANYYPNFPALKNYLHQISLDGDDQPEGLMRRTGLLRALLAAAALAVAPVLRASPSRSSRS